MSLEPLAPPKRHASLCRNLLRPPICRCGGRPHCHFSTRSSGLSFLAALPTLSTPAARGREWPLKHISKPAGWRDALNKQNCTLSGSSSFGASFSFGIDGDAYFGQAQSGIGLVRADTARHAKLSNCRRITNARYRNKGSASCEARTRQFIRTRTNDSKGCDCFLFGRPFF